MMREMGYCNGIENYSRILDGRAAGQPPFTLLDYFPYDFIVFIDESHNTVPQIGGMYEGDRSRARRRWSSTASGCRRRSTTGRCGSTSSCSASTRWCSCRPRRAPFELRNSTQVVEQIIRPTGLVDPEVELRPTQGPDRRPAGRDPRPRARPASACW